MEKKPLIYKIREGNLAAVTVLGYIPSTVNLDDLIRLQCKDYIRLEDGYDEALAWAKISMGLDGLTKSYFLYDYTNRVSIMIVKGTIGVSTDAIRQYTVGEICSDEYFSTPVIIIREEPPLIETELELWVQQLQLLQLHTPVWENEEGVCIIMMYMSMGRHKALDHHYKKREEIK